MTRERLHVIDLFSGVGGIAEGFRQAKARGQRVYDIALLVDELADCGQTYERNHPETPFWVHRITEDTKVSETLSRAQLKRSEVDILVGGPPCQGFSRANSRNAGASDDDKRKAFQEDTRNGLFRLFMRFVGDIRPKVVLIENVPQMLTLWDAAVGDEVKRVLLSLDYWPDARVLHANECGVPQIRRRAIFIGVRKDLCSGPIGFPAATHRPIPNAHAILRGLNGLAEMPRLQMEEDLKHYVTVEQAIADLPALAAGEGGAVLSYGAETSSDYQKERRGRAKVVRNHEAWAHRPEFIARMALVAEGCSLRDISDQGRRSRIYPRNPFSQAYARLHRKGIAYTITTHFHNPGSGRFLHYRDLRAITVREAARLQSFDDGFVFEGTRSSQERQVGNAVPPLLARHLAEHIYRRVFAEGQ